MVKVLPNNWIKIPLGEVVISRKGKKPNSTSEIKLTGYIPYILIHELEGGNVRAYTNDEKVTVATSKDVLLVWDGSIGKCSSGLKGAIGSTIVGITPLGNIPTRFIEYFLKSKKKYILETSTGVGLQHINRHFFKNCILSLPPLKEQIRIVAKLDVLFAHLEETKTRLNKVPQMLNDFRQAVLSKAVSGKLTLSYKKLNNLSNWEKISLGSISTLVTSGSRGWAKYYSDEGAIFVRAQNINQDYLNLNDVAFVKLEGNTEGIRTRIFENDLLITITGANVTKTAVVDFPISEAYVSQHVSLVRLENPKFSKFVYLHLISESDGRKQLNDFAYGQGKPQLNLSNIKNVEIQLPSIDEQLEIVRRVEVLFSKADQIQQRYEALYKSVEVLPETILQKAFIGELVEQLPTDGDAKDLLAEIQKLKDENKKTTKKDQKKKTQTKKKSQPVSKSEPKSTKPKSNIKENIEIDKTEDVLKVLEKDFANKKFTFGEIEIPSKYSYDEFRIQLFKILDNPTQSKPRLNMIYNKGILYFQIAKK